MPLHPFFEKILAQAVALGRPALSAGTPTEARAVFAAMRGFLGPGPEVGAVSDLSLPTRGGSVGARLYRPEGAEAGLLVYLHGGGWVCGGLDDFDGLVRGLVHHSQCAVLSVDYRLAPEHPFPAGLNDAVDALIWAEANCGRLLGDTVPLSVGGDSAGGNLAISAAHSVRDQINLAAQVLFYPVTDCAMDSPSYQDFGTGLPLTRADMAWFFRHYADPVRWADPEICPLRRPSLAGTPPTWIVSAEYDVLRDEAEAYAVRLASEGVAVEFQRATGMPHGFARMANHVDEAAEVLKQAGSALLRFSQAHPQK
ncbi:Aes Esterase/lipase [Paracoccaceae bacterium]